MHGQCSAVNCGDGSDGDLSFTANGSITGGTYNVSSFTIASGVVINVIGSEPLIINSTGLINIEGELTANGGDGVDAVTLISGGAGGAAVAGGYNGGDGGISVNSELEGSAGFGPGGGGPGMNWGGGGGASHSSLGTNGVAFGSGPEGMAGAIYGVPELILLTGGSGGGSGSFGNNCGSGGGGAGGASAIGGSAPQSTVMSSTFQEPVRTQLPLLSVT